MQEPEPSPRFSFRACLVAWYDTRGGRVWSGILASNAGAAIACLLAPLAFDVLSQIARDPVPVAATFSFGVGLPMGIGAIAAYFWRDLGRFRTAPLPARPRTWPASRKPRDPLKPTTIEMLSLSGGNSLFSLLPAMILLREGVVCLLMAFPLLWVLHYVGTRIGLVIWSSFGRVQISLLPLFFLLPALDLALCRAHADRLYRGSVTTRVSIHASPAQIYRYLAAFPPIPGPPDDYWLWRIGAPAPRVSRAQGAFVGAHRECVLGQNTIIQERITRAAPGKALFFRVTRMPRDPEIFGHLYLFRGGFDIVPGANGTCTLVGHTDYGLATRPGWYYDWWAQGVIHAVHYRVMNHIRALAERDANNSHKPAEMWPALTASHL